MQVLYFNGYISPSHLSWDLAVHTYFGAKFCKTRLHNEIWSWTMSPVNYVHEAVKNCKAHLVANISCRLRLPKMSDNPFLMSYNPELDISH